MPVGRYPNASMTLHWAPDEPPRGTEVEPIVLATPDRAATSGLLYRPPGAARALVTVCHPRVDTTSHYLIPPLLRAGYAVWAQRTRTVNNDVNAVHEQLLLDLAAAHAHLARLGFDRQFLLGNSGGASLYCLYLQQASLPESERLAAAPSGLKIDLSVRLQMPAGLILLAPHPGQGELLLHCIDPAVADEEDPTSLIAELDLFNPDNGFHEPPQSSHYAPEFLVRYRAAQRARVERIDARAREIVACRAELRRAARENGDLEARRRALAATYITVHRTDADPRTVDLGLDPSKRDYGSIFGRRPDVTNYGAVGFGRLTTPDAWLSTWSGTSSRAALRLTAPAIAVPTFVLSYTADNSVFPSDVHGIHAALGSADKQLHEVDGDHYGFAPGTNDRRGGDEAAAAIAAWLDART